MGGWVRPLPLYSDPSGQHTIAYSKSVAKLQKSSNICSTYLNFSPQYKFGEYIIHERIVRVRIRDQTNFLTLPMGWYIHILKNSIYGASKYSYYHNRS